MRLSDLAALGLHDLCRILLSNCARSVSGIIRTDGLTTLTAGGSIVIAAVPEPATWGLIGLSLGAAGYVGYRWKRRRFLSMDQEVLDESMLAE